MASITKESNGRKTIQFVASDGKRKSIRLGKAPMKGAEAVRAKVESLVAACLSRHALDDETARWVAAIDDAMADKLAAVELIPKRERQTLKAFLDDYLARRLDVKPATREIWKFVISDLCQF